jgi:hypothetical protein
MRLASLAAVAASLSILATLIAARPFDSAPRAAETYYGCLPNYTFQVSGQNARCYKAGTEVTADIICGIGQVKALDQFNGGKDACQMKTNNVVGNYTCPTGYTPKVQPGPDMCRKETGASILAPSVVKSI